jgi:drug/metabolite transporter (DMT)-like permease
VSDPASPGSTRFAILIPFAIVTLVWGSTWIVIRDQIGVVPPQWSVAYRFLLAGLVMAGVAWWRGDRWPLDRRGLLFAAAMGLFQFGLNFNLVYQSERFVTSGLVSLVFALILVPNAVFARIFLGQKLGTRLLVGSAVAMTGIALLFVQEARIDPNGTERVAVGIGLAVTAVLCASIANVMQGSATARAYPMASMLATAMLFSGLLDAAVAWPSVGPPVMEWRTGYLVGMLYLSVIASALAFTLYFRVIRAIGPAKAGYSGVIVPVIAMLLSTIFEGYRWSTLAAAGGALAGLGLVIALSARRPAR